MSYLHEPAVYRAALLDERASCEAKGDKAGVAAVDAALASIGAALVEVAAVEGPAENARRGPGRPRKTQD